MHGNFSSVAFAMLLTISMLTGCGSNLGTKQSVTGKVTLDNQPLDHGTIQFSPKPGSSGNMSGAEINDGTYSVAREDGLEPGVYEVRIYSAGETAADATALPGESGPAAKDRIPPDFNVDTNLEFTVAEGQVNEFNVDIP